MNAAPLNLKSFQELVFKALWNRKLSDGLQLGEIDWPKFKKLIIFRRRWQLWIESATIKQRYRMNSFFALFRLFVLLPNSISKLIRNRCTCKFIIKTTAAYVYANKQLRLCCYAWIRYFILWYSPLKIILKQLFTSGSVNIGKYSLSLRSSCPFRNGRYHL